MINLLPLFPVISLAGAFLIPLIGRNKKGVSDAITFICTLALFGLSIVSLFISKEKSLLVYSIGGWKPPLGICFVLDGLSAFMLVTLNIVSFLIAIYSISYMEKYTDKYKFYSLFMLMVAGMNGVILTGDIFNLFVFLEIASVASYALVAYGTEEEELEAAFKYAVMGTIASSFILLGIGLLYAYTSTLNMADLSGVIVAKGGGLLLPFVTVLFIAGFGIKSALVPFHAWLPDAHPSAPASISAMLSGVLIKILGIYSLSRILFNVFGVNKFTLLVLMVLGAISLLIGVFLAIGQWDFKRLLAYHSISQVGYIVLAIGLGTPLGILAGLFHLFNHSVFKSLLFLNSGAVEYATGTRDLKAMGGLRQRMPITATTSWIASMAISGVPPFNGFWSKLIIIIACVQSGRIGFAIVAVVGSILTLASFMKVQKYAFFGGLNKKFENIKEVPFCMQLSMYLFAIICIFAAVLLIPRISAYFINPAQEALLSGHRYAVMVLGGGKL